VVRSEKEKRYFHQKSIRNVEFVIWSISEPPPSTLQNNESIVIVTDLYPIDESIQWWLAKLSRPFIAGTVFQSGGSQILFLKKPKSWNLDYFF